MSQFTSERYVLLCVLLCMCGADNECMAWQQFFLLRPFTWSVEFLQRKIRCLIMILRQVVALGTAIVRYHIVCKIMTICLVFEPLF